MLTQMFVVPVSASPVTKTMTVTIGEGGVDQSTLSKTITIPNLKSIENVSVNTGSVSHTKNDENVTLNVSGGTAVRSVLNSTKYSKIATDYSTSSINSFSSTKSYSDADGYSGPLGKDGDSYVNSGSYTPADSKEATHDIIYSSEEEAAQAPLTYYYSVGGYTGTLNRYAHKWEGTGLLYVVYKGTVTKPASDTRTWRQDYKGTVYKAGTDNYYKYTVTIEYIDNSNPTISLTSPSGNAYFGKN